MSQKGCPAMARKMSTQCQRVQARTSHTVPMEPAVGSARHCCGNRDRDETEHDSYWTLANTMAIAPCIEAVGSRNIVLEISRCESTHTLLAVTLHTFT